MKLTRFFALPFVCTSIAFAGDALSGKAPALAEFWAGPIIGGGVKTNGKLTEGSAFLVAPMLDTIGRNGSLEGSVLFLEPYGTWSEGGELGGSLGLGFRRLFSPPSSAGDRLGAAKGLLIEGFYLGANAFLDYLGTDADGAFWQGGLGLEAGTRYLEFRANYYAPFERADVIGGRTATQGLTVTSFQWIEEALDGWDLELAWLVPWVEDVCDLKIIGGYFGYNGDRLPDINGFRAGLEYRPVPAIVLHGTWFQDSKLYDDNWMAGVRVELPLGGDWQAAFTPRRRHLAERLFEPVRRKNAAITTETGETIVSQQPLKGVEIPQ